MKTITIGNQIWSAENLNGTFYNYTQMQSDIIPEGWHVPTQSEWDELVEFCGGVMLAGQKLKQTGFDNWMWPAAWNWKGYSAKQKEEFRKVIEGTDDFGFSAIGAGYINRTALSGFKKYAKFWINEQTPEGYNRIIQLTFDSFSAHSYSVYNDNSKYSIRLIKD